MEEKKCDQEEFGPGAGDLGDHQHIQGELLRRTRSHPTPKLNCPP